MTSAARILRIFVAMPFTTMGSDAPWNKPNEIKSRFYDEIGRRAESKLGRKVIVDCELDNVGARFIDLRMFRACWDADVYLADVTGGNANVFLELGARWALRDSVTILVSQTISKLEFNVEHASVIAYSEDSIVLDRAIDNVVTAIEVGLEGKMPDNPIRGILEHLVTSMSRSEYEDSRRLWERLTAENTSLTRQLSQAYLTAGKLASKPEERLNWFRQAYAVAPKAVEVNLHLARELRYQSYFEEAIGLLTTALPQLPNEASLIGELGMNFSKVNRIDDAIQQLEAAVRLSKGDAELWSNLGGALRRKAFASAPVGDFNVAGVNSALEKYTNARTVAEEGLVGGVSDDLAYAQGNVARLEFALAERVPDEFTHLRDADLDRLRAICLQILYSDPANYYRRFDLADSHLLKGTPDEVAEGKTLYREAIESVPLEYRAAVLTTVSGPLKEFMTLRLGNLNLRAAIKELVDELEAAHKAGLAQSRGN